MKPVCLILSLILITLSACSGGSAAPSNAANGQQLFVTNCGACHGPTGEGITGLGKPLTTSKFVADLSDEELLAFIKTGRPADDPLNTSGVAMPPKGGNPSLTDDELRAIVAYIRSIQKE